MLVRSQCYCGKVRKPFMYFSYPITPFQTAMGKEVSEDEKNKVSWDSNAITPGTPFMDLLASSLRYWVVHKMNTDPGWKNVGDTETYLQQSHQILICHYSFKF